MINFETATREELLAYIEQQKLANKKTNKTDKLVTDLQQLFNEYSNNSSDKLFYLYYLLSALFNNVSIPINEELDKLEYVPEEEDLRKIVKSETKVLVKTDDFKLRSRKKDTEVVVNEVESKEISIPL